MIDLKCGNEEYKAFGNMAMNSDVRMAMSKLMIQTNDKAHNFYRDDYSIKND